MAYHIEQPELFRTKIRGKFSEILGNEKNATNLEKGIYNYAIQEANFRKIVKKWENVAFTQLYMDRLRTIYVNLKNKELLDLVISGEVLPQNLAFMTHQEMNPSRWKEAIDMKMKRNESKYNTKMEASTDMFKCRKCKSNRCTYYELQTRSADEPATVFITCLDCGKHWKS